MAGDLNEPSCLDWTNATKNLFEHRGCVVNWSASALLLQAGFRDAYRTKYPNAVRYPGFTFPADNAAATPQQLSWAIEADERERMVDAYKSDLMQSRIDGDIVAVPERFQIEKTVYSQTEGSVLVTEWFNNRTYYEKKSYTYRLRQREGVWQIYDYTVVNLGTE